MTEADSVLLQDELYANIEMALLNILLPKWREMENAVDICTDILINFLS